MIRKIKYILLTSILLLTLVACKKDSDSQQSLLKSQLVSKSFCELAKEIPKYISQDDTSKDSNTPVEKEPIIEFSETLSKDAVKKFKNYYSLSPKSNGNYAFKLYDKSKKIVDNTTLANRPMIYFINDHIMQIKVPYCNPSYSTYFYNIETSQLSDIYDTPAYAYDDKVIFIEDGKLIIRNVFDKEIYYKVIKRDFSENAIPSYAIFEVKVISDHELEITYAKGENFTETTETLDLNDY